jgi:hypothetical protein
MTQNDTYADIQPDDTTDAGEAVDNLLAKRRRELELAVEREREAYLRELMRSTESALVGETDMEPDILLDELQQLLAVDDLDDVLAPSNDSLADKHKLLYQRFADQRRRRRDGEDVGGWPLRQEYRTYVRVAIELGIWVISKSYTTGYAVAGLPIEEALFFLVTNVFAVQGVVLYLWLLERRHELPSLEQFRNGTLTTGD